MPMPSLTQALGRAGLSYIDRNAPLQILFAKLQSAAASTLPADSQAAPAPAPEALSLELPTYMVWGSNTGVGKTLVSAGLAASAASERVSRGCMP
jgi:hypothetical protein